MDLLTQLRSLLPFGAVLTGDDMSAYLRGWWGRQIGTALCVTLSKTTEEVAVVVRACASVRHRVVPQGGMYGRPPRGKGQFGVSGGLVGCRDVFGL